MEGTFSCFCTFNIFQNSHLTVEIFPANAGIPFSLHNISILWGVIVPRESSVQVLSLLTGTDAEIHARHIRFSQDMQDHFLNIYAYTNRGLSFKFIYKKKCTTWISKIYNTLYNSPSLPAPKPMI